MNENKSCSISTLFRWRTVKFFVHEKEKFVDLLYFLFQTCVPSEDYKQDMSIDELNVLANNKDKASSLDMSPILLHECNTNSEYLEHRYCSLNNCRSLKYSSKIFEFIIIGDATTSHEMSKSSQDLVLVPSINSSTISSPSSGSSPSTSSSINQTR